MSFIEAACKGMHMCACLCHSVSVNVFLILKALRLRVYIYHAYHSQYPHLLHHWLHHSPRLNVRYSATVCAGLRTRHPVILGLKQLLSRERQQPEPTMPPQAEIRGLGELPALCTPLITVAHDW
jgi:hypothetical protein